MDKLFFDLRATHNPHRWFMPVTPDICVGPPGNAFMFGGVGLYYDQRFFGLIARDTLYLKVNDANRAEYEARRMTRFHPRPNKPQLSMTYYELPADVLEDLAGLRLDVADADLVSVGVKRHTSGHVDLSVHQSSRGKWQVVVVGPSGVQVLDLVVHVCAFSGGRDFSKADRR